ncbi:Flp family type IVb pilin [Aurantimonas sp. Leaf443]|uniref:Flp family type IVb pilin n=1 Tax=Aurantimonas sp. Leaf443 TaxID=1736378 RepID=UPI0009EC9E49|nr:Flp family type IVb pilin [Aurantimonas sp. Leaf443]
MTKVFAKFLKDESGATAIEYGLIAALVGVAIIGGATTLGSNLSTKMTAIAGKIGTTVP